VDVPWYANVGDSAIEIGTLDALDALGAPPPCYVADARSYHRTHLAACVRDGLVLLQGGGNFGDRWAEHQRFRERVLSDFPENPILLLPQSAWFASPASLARAREVFDAHPRLTLLLRDRESLAFARSNFRAPSELCPDMAFALAAPAPTPASGPVLWLARGDGESAAPPPAPPAGFARSDWVDEPPGTAARLLARLRRHLSRRPRASRPLLPLFARLQRSAARARVHHAFAVLRDARAVATDRLHGHVLCLLLGIPHFLVDTKDRKISRFVETWTSGTAPICATHEEALALAAEAARAHR